MPVAPRRRLVWFFVLIAACISFIASLLFKDRSSDFGFRSGSTSHLAHPNIGVSFDRRQSSNYRIPPASATETTVHRSLDNIETNRNESNDHRIRGTIIDKDITKKGKTVDSGWNNGHVDVDSLIFVGGAPRSGTTLMRSMLDAHPDIRCGDESLIIPQLLQLRHSWKDPRGNVKIYEGVKNETIDAAIRSFMVEIIARHGKQNAPRLCNQNPDSLNHAVYLMKLFPKAKFIFMIRDIRASAYSVESRPVFAEKFGYRKTLHLWNRMIFSMSRQCIRIGIENCFPMYYEALILRPEESLRKLLAFLGLEWSDNVLHHERFIGQKTWMVSRQASASQVIKPLYHDALTKWVGKIPDDVLRDVRDLAPMLDELGYDPDLNPPDYSKLKEPPIHLTEGTPDNR